MLWYADFTVKATIEGRLNPTQDVAADAALGFIGRSRLDVKGKLSVKLPKFLPQL